ncbi:MAG: hypothetical protein J7J65_05795 [Candidatus Korarchaeota archaeon]|nr:hypothetical protein [Candidatus Korarchaeota archaeon]
MFLRHIQAYPHTFNKASYVEADLIVDTATYTVAPSRVLKELGVKPRRTMA